MHEDDRLEELPEAVPLYRIAPIWRLLAIGALLAVVILLCVGLILGIALVDALNRPPSAAVAPPPPVPRTVPMAVPAPLAGFGGPGLTEEPEEEIANPPYPVTAELAERNPSEPVAQNQPSTARQRFLDIGTDMWKLKKHLPDRVVVSPQGDELAYIVDGNLFAGPVGSPRQIVGTVMQSVPVPVFQRRGYPPGMAPMMAVPQDRSNRGPLCWSLDQRFIYCSDASGHLLRYDLQSGRSDGLCDSQVLPFDGESPVCLPAEPHRLVFVRTRARPKLDVPGKGPTRDFTEVVLGDLNTKEVRVLVPASDSAWRDLALSPDGSRLALVSDRGHEGERSEHLRVFVVDLAGGEPRPVSPPASQAGRVCWTEDSQALVYARSQEPPPPDYWEEEPAGPHGMVDLYHYDLAKNVETRWSRGGGCFSPNMGTNGQLYYLAVQGTGPALLLRSISIATAQEFAQREPQRIGRDAAAWTRLLNEVLQEAKVPTGLDGPAPTPDAVARLAETYNRLYRQHFQVDPPATLNGFGRQRRELERLKLSPAVDPALTFILGALEGEYLVRHHGARWHLTKGPLLPAEKSAPEPVVETPFAYAANPFASVSDSARHYLHDHSGARDRTTADVPLGEILRQADGRTLILTNEPAAAAPILASATDPDLDRAVEILKQGKAEAAEQVFQSLLKEKRHEQNLHVLLQIGNILYENKRLAALQRIMEDQCDRRPRDPRKFNLLGLALLEAQPGQAVDAFKNALRCDLRFEPGYLNLAQAYQMANDLPSARLCLQRYLVLMPNGIYAADARRRLAAVDIGGK